MFYYHSDNSKMIEDFSLKFFIDRHKIDNVVRHCFENFEEYYIKENYSILSQKNITNGIDDVIDIFIDKILKSKIPKKYHNLTFEKILPLNLNLFLRDFLVICDKNDKIFKLPCYFVISTKGDYSKSGELYSGASFSFMNNSESTDEKPVELYLNVNLNSNIKDLINNRKELENILTHEMKHVFDYINGIVYNRKDYLYDKFIGNGEYEAYTGSLLKELEDEYVSNETFETILNRTNVWKFFEREGLFKKYPKVKKYMLSKAYQYWEEILRK
jgi:hypothetical protein